MGDMYVKMLTRSVFIPEECSASVFFPEPQRGYDSDWKVRSGHASQAKAWRTKMASVCSQCACAIFTFSRIQHGCAFVLSYESKRCWAAECGGTLGAVVVGWTARGNHDANQYWSRLQCQKLYCRRPTSRAGEPGKIKQQPRVGPQAWSIGCPVQAAREGNTPH
ncbi:hypothetical protein IG631_00582 [Alternaria alternata]|nr:hypothetical protein IG631_00582 [Alternaria alternata]